MSRLPHSAKRDTRIKPGEIRNPYGRNGKPKPVVDFLEEEVTVSLNGVPTSVSRREALDHFLFANSAQGKTPAIRLLHLLHPQDADGDQQTAFELSHDEREVLDAFVLQQVRKRSGSRE